MSHSRLRAIPSVEAILQALGKFSLPRPIVVRLAREELARLRRSTGAIPKPEAILPRIREQIDRAQRRRIQPVINATGVLVHTNLGRSLLAPAAIDRMNAIASHYSNLEIDLETGARGLRAGYLEDQMALLCQAEAATVTNNCAAALMLILRHFVRGPERSEVIISRGELIQIGGGFRLPEILESSGAQLREVGTTNRTDLEDYRRAVGPTTALILKVHRSNFSMDGFVASPPLLELASLARRARVPLVEDLGSGALIDTAAWPGVAHEPTPAESLRNGSDLVCFSGDKLLSGPQAGIIVGRRRLVAALKREPLFRALRCDKLVLAALEATVELYLDGQATTNLPTLAMAQISPETLRVRAESLQRRLQELSPSGATKAIDIRVASGQTPFGGGALPAATLPSFTLDLRPIDPHLGLAELAARLRQGSPPVIACLAGRWLKLELRTVLPEQDDTLLRALTAALRLPC